MGEREAVCVNRNHISDNIKIHSSFVIAMPAVFYRRGVPCCLCLKYGTFGDCLFSCSTASAWSVLSSGIAPFAPRGTPPVLSPEESVAYEDCMDFRRGCIGAAGLCDRSFSWNIASSSGGKIGHYENTGFSVILEGFLKSRYFL